MVDLDPVQRPKFTPWVEKYRPSKVEEVSHQLEVVAALRKSIQTGQVPHLMFYGPPGTGKTSTILALSKELFGGEFFKQRVIELNASDERGIAVVREKVKKFAQRKIAKHPDSNFNCPSIQIVILDEADSMTIDAQAALRRIIEQYSSNTRFCIICNYISKIIDPLASRCVKFRFSPIARDAQIDRLKFICEKENVKVESDDVFQSLVDISAGDLRRSINTLQTASTFKQNNITKRDIESISGIVPHEFIIKVEQIISNTDGFSDVQFLTQELLWEGFDVQQVIYQILDHLMSNPKLSDLKKARLSEIIAETDVKLIQGGDEEINLLYTLSSVSRIIKVKNKHGSHQ
ncbi:rfc2p [Stylonychia lemnae]|uniref:Rfc2p n=1 Tax=Stylonychia lemnae TaxID=5949 RepID=A0A077ZP48_STYLE|nr:rfc2p [Stylonychia lemnae]|eukprot:CDW71234.1 rfc2p [Stylonychia lemnae]